MTGAAEPLDPDQLRVSDAERNAAMSALGDHMSAGRLSLDEFGTRSAQVGAARTVAELRAPFFDLPGPTVAAPLAQRGPAASAMSPSQSAAGVPAGRSRANRIAAAAAGAAGIIAVILYFLLDPVWHQAWLVFLLIPAFLGIAKAVWGEDWRDRR